MCILFDSQEKQQETLLILTIAVKQNIHVLKVMSNNDICKISSQKRTISMSNNDVCKISSQKRTISFMLKFSFILFSDRKISRLYLCFILSKEMKAILLPSFSCINNIIHCSFLLSYKIWKLNLNAF